MTVYADGVYITHRVGRFHHAIQIEIPSTTKVVGIECQKYYIGGILASFTNGFHSDRDWMCSTDPLEERWNMVITYYNAVIQLPDHDLIIMYLEE